ncbi:ABC transporter ATP-binding protein [Bdellovibrio svalbardensis]|uniref:ABC transporter ATP-binding protein n=1 Tax=Bdellovibrio svalbardensis TaxID=2972972 RepID=A0ABT6DL44_9BACT|nr:ABC transporter ATP-binding protein [Bdellovibrio svalbardensis]MDG0817600.1 ABC transporter ATP-binding protein [Bdellovibrio svalbardensis]
MLELLNIGKSFSSQTALKAVNLSIGEGEFFSLLGPSGCGKTTLLRIIAGLESATEGRIVLNGERVDQLSAAQRPFNMVFQKYALFPHLTVEENIAYGLKLKKLSKNEIEGRIAEVLALVEMSEFRDRRPETLSGGQAQRIAIARALVNRPKVLLLDEPLSALDQKLREHMQKELRALQQKLGLTFIYVTHDQEEALALSDRIGIMNKGELVQVNSPREIYENPETIFASQFLGTTSLLQGELVEISQDLATVRLSDGSLVRGRFNIPSEQIRLGMSLDTYVRKAMVFNRLDSQIHDAQVLDLKIDSKTLENRD